MSNRFLKSQTGMLNRLEKAQTVCTCKEDSSRASRDDPLPRVRRTSSRFARAGSRRRGHGGRPGGVRRLSRRALASAPRTHAPRAARGTHQVRLTPFRAPWCARAPAGRALSWVAPTGTADRLPLCAGGRCSRACGPAAAARGAARVHLNLFSEARDRGKRCWFAHSVKRRTRAGTRDKAVTPGQSQSGMLRARARPQLAVRPGSGPARARGLGRRAASLAWCLASYSPTPPAHTPASCIPRFFLSSLLSPCACACVACARLRRAGVLDRTRATWQLPWPATPTTACNS